MLAVLAPHLKTLAFHFQVTYLYTGEDSRKPQNSQNVKNTAVSRGKSVLVLSRETSKKASAPVLLGQEHHEGLALHEPLMREGTSQPQSHQNSTAP